MQVCIEGGAIRVVEAVVVLNIQENARSACTAQACDSIDASATAPQKHLQALHAYLSCMHGARCVQRYFLMTPRMM